MMTKIKAGDCIRFRKYNYELNSSFKDAIEGKYGVILNKSYKVVDVIVFRPTIYLIYLECLPAFGWQSTWIELEKTVGFVIE